MTLIHSSWTNAVRDCAGEGCSRRVIRRANARYPELCGRCEAEKIKAAAPARIERGARIRSARPITIEPRALSDIERRRGQRLALESEPVERPQTRADCQGHQGPCPFVSCEHHLYLDVNPRTGSIKLNFPDIAPEDLGQLPATCVLDVADRSGVTLEEVGVIMNLTRERIRQVEVRALLKLKFGAGRSGIDGPDTLAFFDALPHSGGNDPSEAGE